MATTSVAYIRVKGTRQGTFKGEVDRKARGDNWSVLFAAGFRDQGNPDRTANQPDDGGRSALSTLRLQIVKTFASPAFFQAQRNGESLSLVEFEFVMRDEKGAEWFANSWNLTDVLIASYSPRHQGGGMALEEMTLSFQRESGMKGVDLQDWKAGLNNPHDWGP
jgi:type VI protein secretion system component Hcp